MAFRTKRDRKPVLGALRHSLVLAGMVYFWGYVGHIETKQVAAGAAQPGDTREIG